MKRIGIVLSLIIMLGMGVANAHLTKGTDDFTQGQRISSQNDVAGQIDSILLTKIINLDSVEYEISINKRTTKEFALAKTTIEIKVDNNPSRKFSIQNIQAIPTGEPFIYSYHAKASIDKDLVDEFKNAKRIAIRTELVNGWQPVIVLREYILNEWKEVIATEK
ncbi:hypothetical protein SRRS_07220 [Sporomusa rhizae]|uniref:hypothetical protein n=1 Tax=Sporomusa rhizae TaxID=357999 RepID=UPI00352BA976